MHLGLTAHTEGEKIVKKKAGDRCCIVSCWGLMIWPINFIFQSEPEGYQVIAPSTSRGMAIDDEGQFQEHVVFSYLFSRISEGRD